MFLAVNTEVVGVMVPAFRPVKPLSSTCADDISIIWISPFLARLISKIIEQMSVSAGYPHEMLCDV